MTPDTRLIESAFPLRQVSRASVHEKSVRHGHVSTLHVWPARRPLAASRAAVLAALLPAPGGEDERRRLLARMAAILPWGGEDPAELARFRAEVRAAFGGRAPRVLDPFAGGGAIPLEAMRLGCAAEAADLNPVAWFLLRCTLHWPRALAGARRPLPGFALQERAFAEAFLKAQGVTGKAALRAELDRLGHGDGAAAQLTAPDLARPSPAEAADAAWHLRAWGRRVLARVRHDLAARYPTYAEFEPRRRKGRRRAGREPRVRYRPRAPRLLAPDAEGRVSAAALNAEFDSYYLEQDANPRWVAKPAVAYLWARTVRCRDCRAEIPLLKTGWLCRKGGKRVALRMTPADGGAGVAIGVETLGDAAGGAAQNRPGDAAPDQWGGGSRDTGGAAHDGTSGGARDGGGGAARARDAGRDAAGDPAYDATAGAARDSAAGAAQDAAGGRARDAGGGAVQAGGAGVAAGNAIGVAAGNAVGDGSRRGTGGAEEDRASGGARSPGGVAHDGPIGVAAGARGRPLGAGTMSRSGASCPVCGSVTTMADLRAAGRAGRLGARLTAVVVDGQQGKEYRSPAAEEIAAARVGADALDALYAGIPFGLPDEATPSEESLGMRIPRYGFDTWRSLFTDRQLLALGAFVREIRRCADDLSRRPSPAAGGGGTGKFVGVRSRPLSGRPAPVPAGRAGRAIVEMPRRGQPSPAPAAGGAGKPAGMSATGDGGAGKPAGVPATAGDGGAGERMGALPNAGAAAPGPVAGAPAGAVSVTPSSGAGAAALGPVAGAAAGAAAVTPSSGAGAAALGPVAGAAAGGETPGAAGRPPDVWREALAAYLACAVSKLADYGSAICSWNNGGEKMRQTFARFALPMIWDYCEVNPLSERTGGFPAAVEWVARVVEHLEAAAADVPAPAVARRSAAAPAGGPFDLICTDPPYYDAIPYSDLMDFFHVWLRRALRGLSPAVDAAFADPRGPKWDAAAGDGELIDDAARFGGDRAASKRNYEEGMARAFVRFRDALRDDGRLVLVFANKSPDAWETLVSALVRSGFVVTGSWPIRTEMETRQRSFASAALSASIWLVCRKRPAAARQGWDGKVLAAMEASITARLRDFWDAGIRGPDFVWAATGPALEAFSRHPVVKKADAPGERLTVAEFLRRVRRMVVGFVVSRLLDQRDGATADLDDPTTYYLLHRADFGLAPAPAGACILYALSCNVPDADLTGRLDLLARGGRAAADDGADADEADDAPGDAGHPPAAAASADDAAGARGGGASGGEVRLKPWRLRRARGLGEPAADGTPPPLVDCLHKLMQLWKTGELRRVDAYLEARGLRRHELFARVTQAIVELAERGSDERALLESIQNHLRSGPVAPAGTMRFDFGGES